MPARVRVALVVLAMAAAGRMLPARQAVAPHDLTQTDLFQPTKIWTAHLTFTADQWKAMEPTRGATNGGSRFGGGEWLQGPPGERNGWGATNGVSCACALRRSQSSVGYELDNQDHQTWTRSCITSSSRWVFGT